jgi:phosphatidate cytidylyltransferase
MANEAEAQAPGASPEGANAPAGPSGFVKNTLSRLATAAVGIPILLYLMFLAPQPAFAVVVVLAIARAAHELMRMTVDHRALQWLGVAMTAALAAVLIFSRSLPLLVTAVLVVPAVGALAALSAPEPSEAAGRRLAWLVAGPLYAGGLLSSVGALHVGVLGPTEVGGQWVLLAMWLAWGSDTAGYFAGRFFGKHPLAPRVSPKKTVEGSIGGLLGSLTGGLAAHFWFLPSLPLAHAVALSLVAGALGQAGDLVESLIKRSTHTKDSGAILPGHGGMLDRIDALMMTATACVLYQLWAG